jgi:predicted negative regulator of RcsB-dependent stress response
MRAEIMKTLNKRQTIALITAIGVLLGGTIAVVEYFNKKKHRQIQQKNAELENLLKQLQLKKLSSEINEEY